jgi:hypothetical protein
MLSRLAFARPRERVDIDYLDEKQLLTLAQRPRRAASHLANGFSRPTSRGDWTLLALSGSGHKSCHDR